MFIVMLSYSPINLTALSFIRAVSLTGLFLFLEKSTIFFIKGVEALLFLSDRKK